MSGNYSDVPANRMSWDRDGTVLIEVDGTGVTSYPDQSVFEELNNEDSTPGITWGFNTGTRHLIIMFPIVTDISGIYFATVSTNGESLSSHTVWSSSPNTTNGIDGTWTDFTCASSSTYPVSPAYRNHIRAVSLTGVKSIKFRIDTGAGAPGGLPDRLIRLIHLYGVQSAPIADRLELWHPTLDERVTGAYFDWGDTPRSSAEDRTFRVKNTSPTLTADTITLSLESLTTPTPSFAAMHTLSLDGTNFAATQVVASLAPDGISDICTLRRTTPADATISVWAARLRAVAGTWT